LIGKEANDKQVAATMPPEAATPLKKPETRPIRTNADIVRVPRYDAPLSTKIVNAKIMIAADNRNTSSGATERTYTPTGMPINKPIKIQSNSRQSVSFQTLGSMWMLAATSNIITVGTSNAGSKNKEVLAIIRIEKPKPIQPLTMPAKNAQVKNILMCQVLSVMSSQDIVQIVLL